MDQIVSGSFLTDLLADKLITREEFDNRFNELLLNAKETMKEESKEKNEFSFADQLKDLQDSSQEDEIDDNDNQNILMTIKELVLLRQQLSSCWLAPAGAIIEKGMFVKINAKIEQNREVIVNSIRMIDTNISQSNLFYRQITESAMRTLFHPNCTPLNLPKDKYNLWKNLIITFDYSIMKGS